MTDELKPCPFCGRPPSVSYPLEDTRQSLYRCVNIECPIYDVRCKPDEWNQRSATPEGGEGWKYLTDFDQMCCKGAYMHGFHSGSVAAGLEVVHSPQPGDTPEPADGMVMVEVLEGGDIWARQMSRDGRLVQCRYNDSHDWYSVTHLHEWDAAEYRLKPAEGVE